MLVNRLSENPIRDPSPYVRRWKGGGGASISGEVQSQGTGTGAFAGVPYADILVHGGPPGRGLVGTVLRVYDHSRCILDAPSLVDYWVWADEKEFWSLDYTDACEALVVCWSASMICCDPDTAIHAEPCPE